MYYYVYMLKTTTNFKNKTYVGYSVDPDKRLIKHNTNKGAKATKGYKWEIIYTKKFKTKSTAMAYEYSLKNNRKKRLIILKLS
ncbi:GIY-YIG nuclease family protein [Candidatus Pelagibacter ubique]|nr:GIY-YIG nuclease family protein [Candidatus Pelagibacter ubique]